MKLHIGCGTVYLDGYVNIDMHIPGLSFSAQERPDIVKANKTTIDNYYGSPHHSQVNRQDIETKVFEQRPIAVDVFADVRDLPFKPGTIDEIRSVQVFEHFSYQEGEELIKHWKKLLKKGGVLHIDIPDLEETIMGYAKAKTQKDKDWYTRLLFGSQKNQFGFHKGMYSKATIKRLLEKHGFSKIKFLPNIHFYPGFAVEATK